MISREEVREALNPALVSILGTIAGGLVLGFTVLVSGGTDYLEQHVTNFKGSTVYHSVKLLIDWSGLATSAVLLLGSNYLALRKLWDNIRNKGDQ